MRGLFGYSISIVKVAPAKTSFIAAFKSSDRLSSSSPSGNTIVDHIVNFIFVITNVEIIPSGFDKINSRGFQLSGFYLVANQRP